MTDDAFDQAERLVREAQRAAEEATRATADGVPPRGWASGGAPAAGPAFPDLTTLGALVDALRGTLPPELARQLADALRELLVAMRAVLDYSIARLERPAAEPVRVEDIPID
jgi:hypothetical protein